MQTELNPNLWNSKTIADVFINNSIEQLEKPMSIEGLEPINTYAAARNLATALEEFAPPGPGRDATCAELRRSCDLWTFSSHDLDKRKSTYARTIATLRLLQVKTQGF